MGSLVQSGIYPGLSEIGGSQPIFSAGQGCTRFIVNFPDNVIPDIQRSLLLDRYQISGRGQIPLSKKYNLL